MFDISDQQVIVSDIYLLFILFQLSCQAVELLISLLVEDGYVAGYISLF
jgi:hypothetical protein